MNSYNVIVLDASNGKVSIHTVTEEDISALGVEDLYDYMGVKFSNTQWMEWPGVIDFYVKGEILSLQIEAVN